MTVLLAVLLFANAAFNVIAWPNFLRRVARDPRAKNEAGKATPFLIVHIVLVTIALMLAAASVVAGIAALVS
ncbi:MAG TPA: hypothetical protein VNT53_11815 [Pseudolysinimonas sp.]|nr:hypothetical protein [Pseudolysinimonas sp.]